MTEHNGFHTRSVHVGTSVDTQTHAVQTPIHQSVSYNFESSQDAADLFALKKFGNIYSRLTNPTVSNLADRITSLEGGAATVVTSSGHAAEILTFFALLRPGDNVVIADKLYGGTINIRNNTFPRFGWEAKTAYVDNLDSFAKAIDDRTRAIFIETFTNPGGQPVDIKGIAQIAHDHHLPLIVDNTIATPYLVRPIDLGADIVVESLTKAFTGNSSIVGGSITESGNFDWSHPKFTNLAQPLPDYNHMVLAENFGGIALTVFNIAVGLRDLGASLSPHSAWLALLGSETLGLRVDRQIANGLAFARHLEQHPDINWVSHSGLSSSPYHTLQQTLSPKGAPSLFSFGVKGGYDVGIRLVEKVQLFRHVVQIGDSRSLIVHPASTTHSQVPLEKRESVGARHDLLRVSIGIEDIEDIIADFNQALEKSQREAREAA